MQKKNINWFSIKYDVFYHLFTNLLCKVQICRQWRSSNYIFLLKCLFIIITYIQMRGLVLMFLFVDRNSPCMLLCAALSQNISYIFAFVHFCGSWHCPFHCSARFCCLAFQVHLVIIVKNTGEGKFLRFPLAVSHLPGMMKVQQLKWAVLLTSQGKWAGGWLAVRMFDLRSYGW